MNIVERVRELGLPFGQYVVIGSGIMDALGMRVAQDIDLAVLPELYQKLLADSNWEQEKKYGHIHLKKEGVEVAPDLPWEAYSTSTHEAIDSATVIEGIPFMNLEELKKFKTALGREKDFRDIQLIDSYVSTRSASGSNSLSSGLNKINEF